MFFHFKNIKLYGREHIPKTGAVLFVCNHQNALLDALLVATTNNRNTHYLTRAGVFKKKFVTMLLNSIQMIPIYRIRDGWNNLSKNKEVFNACYDILNREKALLIFPEGSHNKVRRVRPLSKGFTRIVFGALENNKDLNLLIIPVGLNYNSIVGFPTSVSIYYGEAILANDFVSENIHDSTIKLKAAVHERMTNLTSHVEKENYDAVISQIEKLNYDYQNPSIINRAIEQYPNIPKPEIEVNESKLPIFALLNKFNNFIAFYFWKKIKLKIKEDEFISTFRFAVFVVLFPISLLFQAILVCVIFNKTVMLGYLLLSIILALVYIKYPDKKKMKTDI